YGTGTPTSDDHPGPASLPIHVASCGKHRRVRVMERPSNHRFRGIHERDGVLAVLADRPKVQLNAHSTISTKSTSLCDSAPVRGFGHLRGAPSTSKVWPRHTTFALCVATVPNGANPIYVALDAGRAVKSSEVRGCILQHSTTGPASTHVGVPCESSGPVCDRFTTSTRSRRRLISRPRLSRTQRHKRSCRLALLRASPDTPTISGSCPRRSAATCPRLRRSFHIRRQLG